MDFFAEVAWKFLFNGTHRRLGFLGNFRHHFIGERSWQAGSLDSLNKMTPFYFIHPVMPMIPDRHGRGGRPYPIDA